MNNRSIGYIKSTNKKWTKTWQRLFIPESLSYTPKSFLLIFDRIIILFYRYPNHDLFFYSKNMSSPIDESSSETPANRLVRWWSDHLAWSMSFRVQNSLTKREKSIAELETSLLYIGTCAKQLEKITTLLALTIYNKDSQEDREKYFYTAVELAQRCIKDDTKGVPYWREIISTFLQYIDPGMTPLETSSPAFMRRINRDIVLEMNVWNTERIQQTADLKEILNTKSAAEEILDKLETAFGLIRLLIISDDSGEIVSKHRIDTSDLDGLRHPSLPNIRHTTIRPFDKTRTYSVIIDLGSVEPANQIADHHWENFIQKIINIYIEKKEIEFCINQHTIIDEISSIEKQMEAVDIVSSQWNDYRIFIESVIWLMDPTISHKYVNDPEYIDNLLRALDICQNLTLQHSGNKYFQTQNLPRQIDHILWWRMNSRVLGIVTTILLSHHETMNGLGYPYGLIKKDIPIEARIFSIIQLYAALCWSIPPKSINQAMQYWSRGGSLDSVVLGIFLQCLADGKIWKKQIDNSRYATISSYREPLYTPYIQSWTTIMNYIDEIEQNYLQYRTSWDIGEQSRLAIIIKNLQFDLIEIADLMKMVAYMLHREAPSDLIPWQPGLPGEGLTEAWRENAKKIWKILRGLNISILSSPLRRAMETAELIAYERHNHADQWLVPTSVIGTKALENPPKHNDLNRFDFVSKIIADNPRLFMEDRWRIVSSPVEVVEVHVTHGTVATYANFLTTNLGRAVQDITGTAIPDKSGMGDVHLIRWNRRVDWNLFFPFIGWKEVIRQVDRITEDIFGDSFSPADHWDIHLIHLHKKFIDYMHLKKETSPRQIWVFVKQLNKNPHTKHFSVILRKEGIIQSRNRKK